MDSDLWAFTVYVLFYGIKVLAPRLYPSCYVEAENMLGGAFLLKYHNKLDTSVNSDFK